MFALDLQSGINFLSLFIVEVVLNEHSYMWATECLTSNKRPPSDFITYN